MVDEQCSIKPGIVDSPDEGGDISELGRCHIPDGLDGESLRLVGCK